MVGFYRGKKNHAKQICVLSSSMKFGPAYMVCIALKHTNKTEHVESCTCTNKKWAHNLCLQKYIKIPNTVSFFLMMISNTLFKTPVRISFNKVKTSQNVSCDLRLLFFFCFPGPYRAAWGKAILLNTFLLSRNEQVASLKLYT